ncbi:LacI family DNA-binding transcriptional regulator [Bifidobacterium sp. ESL0764]|uniref:LacI family DNA-binding transcriptional regulator n=1 Tax=Bifidobacterium sp. ESL0764 TaxID=2983228 RepID=UPI0023F71D42|nr:LacI family DNA-binding transcriptional regulator [Bifidobacterium sp. ESL0764]WEV65020.1 LacI family DNA-binding transcriptional regulator [Bifidobacterium sp. ESL0764]
MTADSRKKKVTLPDVARLAGVSVASVSNYLNDYPHMSGKMKDKIRKAIDDLGYVVNAPARNLRSGRTGLITLSIPDLNQIYFAELAEEIIKAARKHGYGVIVESTGNNREREIASVHEMARHMTDGLILSPVKMSIEDAADLEGDFPLVLLGERLFLKTVPHIMIDNENAARSATKHLIDSGCKNIAVVGGTLDHMDLSSRSLRTHGYLTMMRDSGEAFDPRLVRATGEWTSSNGALAVRQMYDEGIRPDGIFALNDLLALGVVSELREMRINVPNDVRVVGFDNIDEAQYAVPALTTVDPDRSSIAEHAVSIISEQARGNAPKSETQLIVPSHLICRDSSPAD